MGDFNYANINWNTLQSMPGATTDSVSFLDCIETNNLTQHAKDPTRGSNVLDLVITGDPDIVHEVEVLDSLADSDHRMVTWMVDITRNTAMQRETLDFNRGDYEAIRQKLAAINWEEYLVGDTEHRWQLFKDVLVQLQRSYIPVKTRRKKATKKQSG